MLCFLAFIFAILLQSFSVECAVLSRQRRDDPASKAQEMAQMGASMAAAGAQAAMDAAKQGVSAQSSRSATVFGQKFGIDKNVKVGGQGSEGSSSSASSEEKNRRKRRSLNSSLHFDKLFAFEPLKQVVKAHKAGLVAHINERRKRQAPGNEGNVTQDSVPPVQEKANDFLQKIREAWADMVKRVGQWMDSVAERMKEQSS